MKYSYLKGNYGRNGGHTEITRWYRISNLGKATYIEKRVTHDSPLSPMYKVGNVVTLIYVAHQLLPSNKREFEKMHKQAMEQIGL